MRWMIVPCPLYRFALSLSEDPDCRGVYARWSQPRAGRSSSCRRSSISITRSSSRSSALDLACRLTQRIHSGRSGSSPTSCRSRTLSREMIGMARASRCANARRHPPCSARDRQRSELTRAFSCSPSLFSLRTSFSCFTTSSRSRSSVSRSRCMSFGPLRSDSGSAVARSSGSRSRATRCSTTGPWVAGVS